MTEEGYFEITVVSEIREVIATYHLMASSQQVSTEVHADETGSTCHQNAHGCFSFVLREASTSWSW